MDLPEQIITQPEELPPALEHLAACAQFGLDTEFVGEDTYHPRLCLVQVATPERLYLIDPLTVGPLDEFWKLVVDPGHEVIVHAGREEVRLCYFWTRQKPGNLFDLQLAAGLVGLPYPLGHGTLVNQVLGVQLAKGETLTEWRDRPLTRAQIRYAFDDVRFLLPLWKRLSERLAELNRTAWAKEEFAHLAENSLPEEAAPEKWRKLRGLGSLDRRRLAMVRALYAWREETAARLNRPARAVVRDDLIVEIARRNPTRERDLQVIRGLPHRDLSAILEVVGQARSLPVDQCPRLPEREQDIPQVNLVAAVLTAVLGDFCARQHLAPNLVASNQDVRLLVRARFHGAAMPAESSLTHGWRAEHVLPELLAVLEGRRGVWVANLRSEAPFAFEDKG
jgi:ribonuclease D